VYNDINKIIEKPCKYISDAMKLNGIRTDEYSKKINLERYLLMLIYGFINKYDLTDIAYKNNISKSELSKL